MTIDEADAVSGRYEWDQVRLPVGVTADLSAPSPGASFAALLIVAGLIGWLVAWWLGGLFAVLFVATLVLERNGPPSVVRAASRIRRMQRRFGTAVQTAVLAAVWGLAVVPLSFARHRGLDSPGRGSSQWQLLSSPDVRLERQFVSGRRLGLPARRSLASRTATAIGGLVLLLMVDLVSGSIVNSLPRGGSTIDARASLPAYATSPWVDEYFAELSATQRWEYEPFAGWRREDFVGNFVNVQEGIRQSWESPRTSAEPLTVWMFGGSTTWGTGQRDDHTVPSVIARLAHDVGLDVKVVNYGESAHLIWQEVQTLEAAILSGEKPDLAIFYDGVNEPARHGDAFSDTPIHSRVHIFENRLEASGASSRNVLIANYKSRSLAVRIARALRRVRASETTDGAVLSKPVRVDEALPNMMAIYSEGMNLSLDIAERHNFEVVHFWQPSIYTKPELESEAAVWTVPGYRELDREWYDAMMNGAREQLPPGVIDIADALDGVTEPVMIDHFHTNELGARIVAERIFAEIEPTLTRLASDVAQP